MGTQLASTMNTDIDSMVTESTGRGEILSRVASAGGISVSTLNQILNATIECPPIERLQGFAEVLPGSTSKYQSAAERDGCEYGEDRNGKIYVSRCRIARIEEITRAGIRGASQKRTA